MKRLAGVMLAMGISVLAIAQQPKLQRAEIKVPLAKCLECKTIIESVAPKYVDGLVKINVIFKRGVAQVQFYPDRTNLEEIKTAIANAGFDADDVTANPDTYKKLPACCKASPK
ncbi:MAG TPA: heavy-metal-associated domain-containing protein [Phnomibacter sp.]|nr:heavy-metal-associated domain-containing protein [Phnomibacter sp.]